MQKVLLFLFMVFPMLSFGQTLCPDYKSTLSMHCSTNTCTSMADMEGAFAKTGMPVMSMSADCQAQAYKNMTEVLIERLAIEKEAKAEAEALAAKRKKTNTVLGITTGVAAAGAIGLGVAYGKEKKKNKDSVKPKAKTKVVKGDSKVCTEDQIRAIARAGQAHYADQLKVWLSSSSDNWIKFTNFEEIYADRQGSFNKSLGEAVTSPCSISF